MRILSTVKGALFSVLSGALLYFSWPTNSFYPLLFIAFVPLLFALKDIAKPTVKLKYLKAFLLCFSAYFIWTSLVLIWLYKTGADTHLLLVISISINYSLLLGFYPVVYARRGFNYAFLYFVSAILVVDWVSQNFLLSTPYFNLGLGFGKAPWLIQHYKWIGVEGGTLWIALINLFFYKLIDEKIFTVRKLIPLMVLIIIIPTISLIIYNTPLNHQAKKTKVVLHHSCYNPATQETFESPTNIVDSLFAATFNDVGEPSLVVWPESAIIRLGWLHQLDSEPVILHLKSKLQKYPNTTVVFGAIGFSHAQKEEEISVYTTYVPEGNYYYNTHNLAISVRANYPTQIKSKEQFIPFHERIPYVSTFPFMKNLVEIIGNRVMFTYFKKGNQLTTDANGDKYVSVICYESIFSLFMANKSSNKTGAIILHANEHWQKDINGSLQYLFQTVSMAIQGGKSILRSSNCGVSGVINQKGDVVSKIVGNTNNNIEAEVALNYEPTFYSLISGLFYLIGSIGVVVILLLTIFKSKM